MNFKHLLTRAFDDNDGGCDFAVAVIANSN